MLYFGSFFAGVINGLFASGAGQIIVFILIYFLNIKTHNARATSVFAISIVTIFTFIRYMFLIEFKIKEVIIVAICGLIFGGVGAKIMKKIPADYLNLISGMLISGFAIYSIIKG